MEQFFDTAVRYGAPGVMFALALYWSRRTEGKEAEIAEGWKATADYWQNLYTDHMRDDH